jgi:Flp pilus assembly protein TadD
MRANLHSFLLYCAKSTAVAPFDVESQMPGYDDWKHQGKGISATPRAMTREDPRYLRIGPVRQPSAEQLNRSYEMLRPLIRLAVLAVVLFPASSFGQGKSAALVGTLTITAKEGTKLPEQFFVVLYRSNGREFARQQVANHGSYRITGVSSGDYEIAVEGDGRTLGRMSLTVRSAGGADVKQDLELQWRDKSAPASAGTISSLDLYKRSPENESLMNQALAAMAKKNYAEAAGLLKQVVGADAKDFEAWTELGNVLFAQGNQSEAEKAFGRALEERPSYPVALLNLGKMQYDQKNYDGAIATLSQLVGAHPESAEAHRFLGEAYLQIKKGSKAVPELEEAARLDPENQADAHLSLAALYDAANLKDRAAGEYEKFLAQKPNYPDKKKLEKYIRDNKKR